MILYTCELPAASVVINASAEGVDIERVTGDTLQSADYHTLINAWNPSCRARQFTDRFAAGADLWLAKTRDGVSGFGWTLKGGTIEPHYFPIKPNEVHLFDFHIFPEFRGRGINAALIHEILKQLSSEKAQNAYIECAAWNNPQIHSLKKTPFKRTGEATKLNLFGKTAVIWHRQRIG